MFLFSLLANGCMARPLPPAATSTHPAPATVPPTTVTSPTPSPPPTPTSTSPPRTATPTRCEQQGRVQEGIVENDGFGRDLPFLIYLPPCQPANGSQLPTLYLLHGLTGHPQQWLDIGLVEAADGLIQSGQRSPFLVVMPWQRTGVELEPAVIGGLLPHIESSYPARSSREYRALGGISRGAGWAFRIGFRHWGTFGAIGLHSPGLLAGDTFAIERWLPQEGFEQQPRVWIDIGDRDSLLGSAEEIGSRLDELGMEYEFHLQGGLHDQDYWRQHLEGYLRWYSEPW